MSAVTSSTSLTKKITTDADICRAGRYLLRRYYAVFNCSSCRNHHTDIRPEYCNHRSDLPHTLGTRITTKTYYKRPDRIQQTEPRLMFASEIAVPLRQRLVLLCTQRFHRNLTHRSSLLTTYPQIQLPFPIRHVQISEHSGRDAKNERVQCYHYRLPQEYAPNHKPRDKMSPEKMCIHGTTAQ